MISKQLRSEKFTEQAPVFKALSLSIESETEQRLNLSPEMKRDLVDTIKPVLSFYFCHMTNELKMTQSISVTTE